MPKKKKSSKRGKNAMAKVSPDPTVLIYNGPPKLPQAREENRTETLELKSVLSLTSSVAGVIDTVIDNNPSGYLDWSSIAALWDEYRALSLMVHYFPYNRYSKSTTTCRPWYQVVDRDSNGVLSSVNAAAQYESCVLRSLEDPWTAICKMIASPSGDFKTTASPSFTFCIKGYQTGLSASTTYGEVLITLLVQVRGRN